MIIDYPDTYAKLGAALVRTGKFDPSKAFVADALAFSTVPSNIPPQAIEGARGTRGGTPKGTDAYKLFDSLWQKAGGVEHYSLDANSFDSATLCFLAAAAGKSADPAAIARPYPRCDDARRAEILSDKSGRRAEGRRPPGRRSTMSASPVPSNSPTTAIRPSASSTSSSTRRASWSSSKQIDAPSDEMREPIR